MILVFLVPEFLAPPERIATPEPTSLDGQTGKEASAASQHAIISESHRVRKLQQILVILKENSSVIVIDGLSCNFGPLNHAQRSTKLECRLFASHIPGMGPSRHSMPSGS